MGNLISNQTSDSSTPKLLQDPETKYEVKLIEKYEISHDTRRFRFALPSNEHVLGLPIGQHVYLSATLEDKVIARPYTPVSSDEDKGFFELVVKIYFKNVHLRFPDGGKLTQYLESLKIGDTISVRGPNGLLVYKGKGEFAIKPDKKSAPVTKHAKHVGMVAGGTGIAPMLQIIREVLRKSATDKTELRLIFANQTPDDILLKKELDECAQQYPEQFKVFYTVDRPTEDWKQGVGFVDDKMIKEHLPQPGPDTLILICGPPPMAKHVHTQLDKLDYSMDMRFKY